MYDKQQTLHFIALAQEGDKQALSAAVDINMGLVKSIARRFVGRGCDIEDLNQLGAIGLIKAIKGFDLSMGNAFSTYAVPYITGEIQRFLRDDGLIKVSRETKRNARILLSAKESYEKEHNTSPTLTTLCEITSINKEDALCALEAVTPALSINQPCHSKDNGEKEIGEYIGADNIEKITENIALHQVLNMLTHQEKTIITLRYFKGLTQSEVARLLNSNQVKISRTEKKIIEKLRKELLA